MPNITISVPEELYKKMRKRSEVKWSEVVRKALIEYLEKLDVIERGAISSNELADMLRESKVEVSSIDLEKAIEHYERSRELEWKRFSTIRGRS